MVSSRQKILQYLQNYQPASIREIGKALDLTAPDILYHVQFLLKSGEIESAPKEVAASAHRGRPIKRYRLSHPSRPENNAFLAKVLFSAILSQCKTEKEKNRFLKKLAWKIAPKIETGVPINIRIAQLVKYCSENQYAARWEAHHSGPQIIFSNCPYLSVARECPDLCMMDRLLIENFLDAPVSTLQTCLADDKPVRQCRFLINT
ncbi:MAG: helix-turn-helix transcriptional regulator [Anaerolineaceae bacterium]